MDARSAGSCEPWNGGGGQVEAQGRCDPQIFFNGECLSPVQTFLLFKFLHSLKDLRMFSLLLPNMFHVFL